MGTVYPGPMLEDLEFTKRDEKILYIADAMEKYKKAGISGKANFGERPVVLIVDVQKGFTSTENPLGGNMDSMVENIKKLIREARSYKVPIFYTRVAYREDGKDCGVFGEKVPTLPKWFRDGGGWDGIDGRIAPRQEDFPRGKYFRPQPRDRHRHSFSRHRIRAAGGSHAGSALFED